MSALSVRAFDAMAQLAPARNPDVTQERREAIYAALHQLERLEADRRNRRKSLDGRDKDGRGKP